MLYIVGPFFHNKSSGMVLLQLTPNKSQFNGPQFPLNYVTMLI